MNLKERRRLTAMHPRVTFHREPTRCTAFAASRTTVSTYYHPDPEVRAAKQERARCKLPAHWIFKALKGKEFGAHDGVYCWEHIGTWGMYANPDEEAATERWLKRLAKKEGWRDE